MQSHVPSNQLLKPSSSQVPHLGAVTAPDQIEEVAITPVSTRITDDASSPIDHLLSANSQLTNSLDDSINTPNAMKSEALSNVENQSVS